MRSSAGRACPHDSGPLIRGQARADVIYPLRCPHVTYFKESVLISRLKGCKAVEKWLVLGNDGL